MFRLITAGDRKVMHRVNQWTPPLWMRRWMVFASRAGDGWGWLVFGAAILIWGGERRFTALEGAFVSVLAGQAVFNVVKRLTGRTRPCATESSCWATLLPPDRFSFPSGHTISAFAVAVPLGLSYPLLLPLLIFCAMSVASSRVLLGLHYLSDVLAGIVIGCLLGMGGFWLAINQSL
jgi:undecaprenyl-diphosphatase